MCSHICIYFHHNFSKGVLIKVHETAKKQRKHWIEKQSLRLPGAEIENASEVLNDKGLLFLDGNNSPLFFRNIEV